jgi:enamine deaminase RidA (YjgF/YER057c/UK114 family)
MSESGSRVARRIVDVPEAAFPGDVPASPAVVAGDFVFTSPMGATDWATGLAPAARADADLPLSGDDPIAIETRELYRKLGAALEAGGSSFARSVQINQWVNTYRGFDGLRHPADRDEVGLFYEEWRPVVNPFLATRNEFLLNDRPASACMPVDRFMCSDENVNVELVGTTEQSGIEKRAFEHDVHMPLGGYSIGIEAGPWLFTAGFTGVDFAHGIRPESKVPDFVWYGNQIHNETMETLRQLKVTVEAGGGKLEDTVKALVYVTPFGMRNLPALNAAWETYWPEDPPARAIIPCTGVGLKGTNVEIMLTVTRPGEGNIEREVVQTDKAPAIPGPAPQALKAGGLLFLSTQVGIGADGVIPGAADNDRAFPFMRRSVKDELRLIQENADAICQAAGTSIDQTVKSHLFFSDFEDLAASLPVWGDAFTDGYPAAGFYETPPGTQEVPAAHVTADMIVACPE